MTLLIAAVQKKFALLVADRRLSSAGILVDDKENKSGVLYLDNMAILYGYTGLSKCGSYNARRWFCDMALEAAKTSRRFPEFFDALEDVASASFMGQPDVRRLREADRRLTVAMAGFRANGQRCLGFLSNFEKFGSLPSAVARPRFVWQLAFDQGYGDDSFSAVHLFGAYEAVLLEELGRIGELLQRGAPANSVRDYAVRVVEKAGKRSSARGSIGPYILSSILDAPLPEGKRPQVRSRFHTIGLGKSIYLADIIAIDSIEGTTVARDIELRREGDPAMIGAVHRNSACPCGSGFKYRHCHGHQRERL